MFKIADGGHSVTAEPKIEGLSHAVAFSADSAQLAVARADARLVDVWDLASRQRRHSFRLPEASVSSLSFAVSFSGDGGTLAAGNDDGTTIVWDLRTGLIVGRPLVGLRGAAEHVTLNVDASHVITASATGVASWDLERTALSTSRRLDSPVEISSQSVAFSPDGHRVATIGPNGQLVHPGQGHPAAPGRARPNWFVTLLPLWRRLQPRWSVRRCRRRSSAVVHRCKIRNCRPSAARHRCTTDRSRVQPRRKDLGGRSRRRNRRHRRRRTVVHPTSNDTLIRARGRSPQSPGARFSGTRSGSP